MESPGPTDRHDVKNVRCRIFATQADCSLSQSLKHEVNGNDHKYTNDYLAHQRWHCISKDWQPSLSIFVSSPQLHATWKDRYATSNNGEIESAQKCQLPVWILNNMRVHKSVNCLCKIPTVPPLDLSNACWCSILNIHYKIWQEQYKIAKQRMWNSV